MKKICIAMFVMLASANVCFAQATTSIIKTMNTEISVITNDSNNITLIINNEYIVISNPQAFVTFLSLHEKFLNEVVSIAYTFPMIESLKSISLYNTKLFTSLHIDSNVYIKFWFKFSDRKYLTVFCNLEQITSLRKELEKAISIVETNNAKKSSISIAIKKLEESLNQTN